MEGTQEALRSCLLADLNHLALEAKRPESLAGQLTGWISGPEHPSVKDAVEKTIKQLSEASWAEVLADKEVSIPAKSIKTSSKFREFSHSSVFPIAQKNSLQAALRPFLVACSTKSPKLANTTVASLQKLLTRHNLRGNGLAVVIKILEQVHQMQGTLCKDYSIGRTDALALFSLVRFASWHLQVERINDEGVKLKILQTSLTLMQMPELAQDEVSILHSQI